MKNKNKHLTSEQRYTIFRMLQAGCTRKEICTATGKDKSVICLELKRNSHKRGYSPGLAQQYADERKERFNRKRKLTEQMKQKIIKELTQEQWSPEQIVGKSKRDGCPMVSHETIYQLIRKDKAEAGELYQHLRHRLKHRKRPVGGKKILIPDKLSIDLRPAVINNKERYGDWEIDTIVGKENKGAILTATERKTGFLLMKKLPKGKNAKDLAIELFYLLLPYKKMVLSITSDNGSEFYEHKKIAKMLHTTFYFAHPYSSWERGVNEYTNKLIRQYIPKKESFSNYDDEFIKNIQYKLNRRPRKLLNFDEPYKVIARAMYLPGCI
ncbi:MAG: IS30 family transposase [Prevotellaceae bacterium]|jgi:IS30 family transposase|nr:IS30 family transposase [Prevotellaceae bacterium]